MTSYIYVLKCYCRPITRYIPHLSSAEQDGKSLKCSPSLKSLLYGIAVLQLVSDTIENKTVPNWYLWLRFIWMWNSDLERKMQHNSIVIERNTAMTQLHKKCDFANFTLIFSFKLNSDDKINKSHISFTCFWNVAFQSARCINMHFMKNNENGMKV